MALPRSVKDETLGCDGDGNISGREKIAVVGHHRQYQSNAAIITNRTTACGVHFPPPLVNLIRTSQPKADEIRWKPNVYSPMSLFCELEVLS